MSENGSREACCSVGYGGDNRNLAWHITWLPKGYGITAEDRVVCAFAEPEDGSWEGYGFSRGKRPPVIEAVCEAIESFYKNNPTAPPPGRLTDYAAQIQQSLAAE